MYRKTLTLAAILASTVTGTAFAADLPVKAKPIKAIETPYFLVNENSLSYHYEFTATEPGLGRTPKHVGTFSHFDVWAYGTNFFNLDWLKATSRSTPSNPCPVIGGNGCDGFTEIYGFFRSTLGWNELGKTKMWSMGPLKNISFAYGADFNASNTFLGSAKRSVQAGLQFDFATPFNGNLSLTGFAYKELQHNGFTVLAGVSQSGRVEFDTTWGFGANYTQPLGFLPPSVPLTFKGIIGMHGPKGIGQSVGAQSKTEIFSQATLDLDTGKIFWGKSNMWSVWAGYRYWHNKFGLDDSLVTFANESTWLTGTTWAF